MIPELTVTYPATPDELFDTNFKKMMARWGFDCVNEQMDRGLQKRVLRFVLQERRNDKESIDRGS